MKRINRFWKDGELTSLIQTLKRNSDINNAVREHNLSWKSGRSIDSVRHKFQAEGLGSPHDFLKQLDIKQNVNIFIQKLVKYLKGKDGRSLMETCDYMNMSPGKLKQLVEDAQASGYRIKPLGSDVLSLDVTVPKRNEITKLDIKPVKNVIRFAVASDLHFASKVHYQEELEDFMKFAYNEGVLHVFNPGDIFAGINMYRGQLNEIETPSFEGQVAMGAQQLPKHDGLTYHMIGGNHDESFNKAVGADPIAKLADLRPDVINYGFYNAMIDMHGVKIEIHHPDKAGAYAITYNLQKEIENIPGGMKPNIAFWGHTHQSVMLPAYRNIAAFYAGCFEGQTLYLKRKHIDPMIGGWVIELGLTDDNSIRYIRPTWVHYFHGTRNICNPTVGDAPSVAIKKIKYSDRIKK